MDLIRLNANWQHLSSIKVKCQTALWFAFSKRREPINGARKRPNHLWPTCECICPPVVLSSSIYISFFPSVYYRSHIFNRTVPSLVSSNRFLPPSPCPYHLNQLPSLSHRGLKAVKRQEMYTKQQSVSSLWMLPRSELPLYLSWTCSCLSTAFTRLVSSSLDWGRRSRLFDRV